MEANYNAMMGVAVDKYSKLIEEIYKIKSEKNDNFQEILDLINSIHKDEVDLITYVHELKCEKENRFASQNIQVFSFMY